MICLEILSQNSAIGIEGEILGNVSTNS